MKLINLRKFDSNHKDLKTELNKHYNAIVKHKYYVNRLLVHK